MYIISAFKHIKTQQVNKNNINISLKISILFVMINKKTMPHHKINYAVVKKYIIRNNQKLDNHHKK